MPGPAGSAFKGGRSSGDTVWIESPNGAAIVGKIKQAGKNMDAQLDKIASFLADDMADVAKTLVAKDERKVMKSIRTEKRLDGWHIVADRQGERDEVAIYLEIGTHKMAARPYMVPAMRLTLASGGLFKASKQAGGLLGHTNL